MMNSTPNTNARGRFLFRILDFAAEISVVLHPSKAQNATSMAPNMACINPLSSHDRSTYPAAGVLKFAHDPPPMVGQDNHGAMSCRHRIRINRLRPSPPFNPQVLALNAPMSDMVSTFYPEVVERKRIRRWISVSLGKLGEGESASWRIAKIRERWRRVMKTWWPQRGQPYRKAKNFIVNAPVVDVFPAGISERASDLGVANARTAW